MIIVINEFVKEIFIINFKIGYFLKIYMLSLIMIFKVI